MTRARGNAASAVGRAGAGEGERLLDRERAALRPCLREVVLAEGRGRLVAAFGLLGEGLEDDGRQLFVERSAGAEGRRRIENALAADDDPSAARAAALNHAAIFAIEGADVAAVKARAEEGLELHRRLERWREELFGSAGRLNEKLVAASG